MSQYDDERRDSRKSGSMFPVIFLKELYLDLKNVPLCLILALASELPPSKFAGLLFCHCEPRGWDNDGSILCNLEHSAYRGNRGIKYRGGSRNDRVIDFRTRAGKLVVSLR